MPRWCGVVYICGVWCRTWEDACSRRSRRVQQMEQTLGSRRSRRVQQMEQTLGRNIQQRAALARPGTHMNVIPHSASCCLQVRAIPNALVHLLHTNVLGWCMIR